MESEMTVMPTTIEIQRGLHQLYDRTEITDLVYRLGACLDEGRYDELRELLVEDATVSTPGGQAEGRAALIAQARRNHPADQRFQHVTTNVQLDPYGGPSHAPVPSPRCTIGEVYSFELLRTPGGWRFSRIGTVPLWMSGTVPTPARAG
jgi:hypothetical protein